MNTDKLKKWAKDKLDLSIDIELGDYFEYHYYEDLVVVSKDIPAHFKGYLKYCRKLGLTKYTDPRLIAFLHEIGHAITVDNYMGLFKEFINRISFILDTPCYTQLFADIKAWFYYRVPIEKEATLWAVDYINNNDISDLEDIWKEL